MSVTKVHMWTILASCASLWYLFSYVIQVLIHASNEYIGIVIVRDCVVYI